MGLMLLFCSLNLFSLQNQGHWKSQQRWWHAVADLLGCVWHFQHSWILLWHLSVLVPFLLHAKGMLVHVVPPKMGPFDITDLVSPGMGRWQQIHLESFPGHTFFLDAGYVWFSTVQVICLQLMVLWGKRGSWDRWKGKVCCVLGKQKRL